MPEASLAELIGTAHSLTESGRRADALALYRRWIAAQPDDSMRHVPLFNLSVLLGAEGEHDAAAEAARDAARHAPGFLPPFLAIGLAHERKGEPQAAIDHWSYVANSLGAITRDGIAMKVAALKNMARLFEDHAALHQAEDVLRQVMDIDPTQQDVLQRWLSLRQRRCAWPLRPDGMAPAALLRGLAPVTLLNMTEDPFLHLAHAAACHRRDVPAIGAAALRLRRAPGRLRIGYLSSDLRDHAVGHLMADLFRHHDRAAVEIFVYDCGLAREDATKRRIRHDAEHWRDIIAVDDAAAAALMRDDGIDILVDLNGHTRGSRPGLLALRPAPALVNWLGYPGTMGSPLHHYIIADATIIPPGWEDTVSERVLRLPCYQPNDRQRIVAPPPSRAALGLPEDAVVFCCFNGTQKLTAPIWESWVRILRATPGSVLWLIHGGDAAEIALRARWAEAGLDAGRLVFARAMPNPQHVARYAAADIVLDTWPYGAHTTASDALWMGAPVLTVPGLSFASRVCASLVRAAGVPEMVCADWAAYEQRAIALAADPTALAALRARLLAARETSVLFDTAGLARALEALFAGIARDIEADRLPRPNLVNLEIYLDIGVDSLRDDAVPMTRHAMLARWQAALAARDAMSPLPSDGRLWPAALPLAAE